MTAKIYLFENKAVFETEKQTLTISGDDVWRILGYNPISFTFHFFVETPEKKKIVVDFLETFWKEITRFCLFSEGIELGFFSFEDFNRRGYDFDNKNGIIYFIND